MRSGESTLKNRQAVFAGQNNICRLKTLQAVAGWKNMLPVKMQGTSFVDPIQADLFFWEMCFLNKCSGIITQLVF